MKSNLLLIAICLASFLGCLDLTIVNTALPSIQQYFQANVDVLQWVMTGLFAALSGTMVLAGKVADMFGHRKLMLIGLVIFGLASLAAGIAPSMSILIIARIVQGLSIAILYTAPPAFINHIYTQEQVPKAMGYYFSASSLGIASGPLLGGFIVAGLGWQWIFYVNIPIVLFVFIIIFFYSTSHEITHKQTFDIKGATLLILSLIVLLLATNYINKHSMLGWSMIIFSLIGFTLFIFHEKKIENPLLDLRLFHYPTFTFGGIANIALACFYTNAFFLMPLYLSTVKHFDAFYIGLILLPATLTLTIISPWVNKLVQRYSVWNVLIFGLLCFALNAFIQLTFNQDTSVILIMIVYTLIGIGWASILSPSFTSALLSIPQQQAGVAMGTLGTLHNAGGSIGLAIGVMLFSQTTNQLNAQQFIAQQTAPFIWIGSLSVLVALMIFIYRRKRVAHVSK